MFILRLEIRELKLQYLSKFCVQKFCGLASGMGFVLFYLQVIYHGKILYFNKLVQTLVYFLSLFLLGNQITKKTSIEFQTG